MKASELPDPAGERPMLNLIDRLLHLIGYRHADWRPYEPYMMRFREGRWERREPTPDEFREMEDWQAFQI